MQLGYSRTRETRLAVLLGLLAIALAASSLPAAGGHGSAAGQGSASANLPVVRAVPGTADGAPTRPLKPAGKLDSALAGVAAEAAQSRARGLERARAAGIRTDGGRVQVLVTVGDGELAAASAAVEAAGGEVTGTGAGGRYVQAFVPVAALEQVAQAAAIQTIARPPTFEALAGDETTQGDSAANAPAWRSAGLTGSGVKIGIVDVGFLGYKDLLGKELPSSVTVKNFVDGQTTSQVDGTTPHGTACAEIVHDIAPDAALFLAKVATVVDIEEAVAWLKGQGVHIISSSIGAYNVGPGDGTGYLEDIVADARAAGVTWFTAAGNDREAHWSGTTNLTGGGYQLFGSGQDVNFFGPGDGTAYAIDAGEIVRVFLRWSDWTNVNEDYDLELMRWSGSSWQSMSQSGGTDLQSGQPGQRPVELAVAETTGDPAAYGYRIHRASGSSPVTLQAFVPQFWRPDKTVVERSLISLADSASAVTVAAVDVGSFVQEPYSSEGPTNGPGGTATGGLAKPEISSYANVDTVSYGPGRFNGTSAATPHVAAAAALVRQANPSFTPDQLESFMAERAVDLGVTGFDTIYGAGRVHLGTAPAVDTTPPTVTAPNADFRTGVNVAKKSPHLRVRVGFEATDASGIDATRLQQKVNSGSYKNVTLSSLTATFVDLRLPKSKTAQRRFRARATDTLGNTSSYTAGPWFRLRAFQNGSPAIVQSGKWTTASNSNHFNGSVRYAKAGGRKQTLTMTMQDVAIVAMKGAKKGIAKVFVDGALVATIDLYSPTKQFRQVVWAMDFGSAATHTVEFRVTGTKNAKSGGTRVDFDAFLVMQP